MALVTTAKLLAPQLGYAAQRLGPIVPLSSATINGLDVSRKRPATLSLIGGPDPKRLKLSDFGTKRKSKMVRRGRTAFRRRSRRTRRFRRKRSFGRRSFAKRVKRVIFRTLERKVNVSTDPGFDEVAMAEGDGTTRVIYVHSPVSAMNHSDEEDGFHGNEFWLKALSLRGQLSMDTTTPPATAAIVRFTLLWSKDQGSGFDTGFVSFGNTTTANTNPAQTAPNVNPRFFMNTAVPFVGQGYVVPFDTTRHKVIRSWIVPVNPSGDSESGQLSMPTLFKLYVPIRKMMQIEDATQGPLTQPVRFKNGTYWWVIQVIASNVGTSADPVVNMEVQALTYFRDP